MSADPSIVLTNDDGIDSPGLHALQDALSAVGDVTVVAPSGDQSAVGRSISGEVRVAEHERGYAIDGTPADCVVAAVETLCPGADLVVAGCNHGANLGMYVLGRSGTVSAAVEAAYFGVPAIAVSRYVPAELYEDGAHERADYEEAAAVTRYLAARAPAAGVFTEADYLNVNVPTEVATAGADGDETAATAEMEITRPSLAYEMSAQRNGDTITLHDEVWERLRGGKCPDPPGTDRRAVAEGRVSVSPLAAPHATLHHESLDELAAAYGGSDAPDA
ncbi:MAG: 5'/3'-nucleotidase SurE [Halobacteriaceae archaeon]